MVNTDVSSRVTSIVNSTAFEVNTDIIIANGDASVAVSSTSDVGELSVYVSNGSFGTNIIYTDSNAIWGSVNTVIDKTVSAKIIKYGNTINISVANTSGTFSVGEVVTQNNGPTVVANGTVSNVNISGGIGSIEVSNYSGVFETQYPLEGSSNNICNIDSFSIQLAVQYNRFKNVEATVNTDANATTLIVFSSGDTTLLQPGDQLYQSSNVNVITNVSSSFIESVVNSTAVVMDSNVVVSNGTVTLTFMDITDNDLVTNNDVFSTTDSNTRFNISTVSLGSGAEYSIVNVETSETVLLNTDIIGS